jgi:hypothetical protein
MAPMKDKTLFIVTSALNPEMGIINREERLNQSLDGVRSIRERMPDAIVLMVDGSPNKIEEEKVKALKEYVNFFADFSQDREVIQFSSTGRKSEAENVLLFKTMLLLKQDDGLNEVMQSVNRIVKLSGRTILTDEFDIANHDHAGKYVFKKRMPTWIADDRNKYATDLLITRMYSLCPTLIDNYMNLCSINVNLITQTHIDTEHAHFVNINKDLLVELDTIHCQGIMAGTGLTEIY